MTANVSGRGPSSEEEIERIIAAGERKEQIYLDLCDMVLDPGVEQQDC